MLFRQHIYMNILKFNYNVVAVQFFNNMDPASTPLQGKYFCCRFGHLLKQESQKAADQSSQS